MKTVLILAGAITLVLISMKSPAFGSPAPPNEASASLMSDTLIDNEGLVRQKRGTGVVGAPCTSNSDCRRGLKCDYYISSFGFIKLHCTCTLQTLTLCIQ